MVIHWNEDRIDMGLKHIIPIGSGVARVGGHPGGNRRAPQKNCVFKRKKFTIFSLLHKKFPMTFFSLLHKTTCNLSLRNFLITVFLTILRAIVFTILPTIYYFFPLGV